MRVDFKKERLMDARFRGHDGVGRYGKIVCGIDGVGRDDDLAEDERVGESDGGDRNDWVGGWVGLQELKVLGATEDFRNFLQQFMLYFYRMTGRAVKLYKDFFIGQIQLKKDLSRTRRASTDRLF